MARNECDRDKLKQSHKSSENSTRVIFIALLFSNIVASVEAISSAAIPTTPAPSNAANNTKMMQLGSVFPNFKAKTTKGEIDFHEWLENKWGILFSHPADFTPVCTTELARVAQLMPEFEKRCVKPIALSLDSVENHLKWQADINAYGKISGDGFPYPIIADENRELSRMLNMLDLDEKDSHGLPMTARAVFIIDCNKKFRLSILYPATTGRNFDEVLRVIDSLQLTDKYRIATPADWKQGDAVMIQPSVSAEEAAEKFPNHKTVEVPSGEPYLRVTTLPLP